MALLAFPGALRGWTLSSGDQLFYVLGQIDAFVASVGHVVWPVWDPGVGFGQPMLADPGSQVLYPLTWLNLLMLPETYIVVYAVGHSFWAGFGAYLLGRKLRLGRWSAWLTGAGWLASGPFLSQAARWQHQASAAWMPWVLMAALRCNEAPGVGRALALALVLALQWLAGSAEIAAVTLIIAVPWTLAAAWRNSRRGQAVGAWGVALAWAVALTAALWLPALDHARHSARSAVAGRVQMWWAVPPWRWVELVAPVRPDELPLSPAFRRDLFGPAESTIVASLYVGATLSAFALYGFWASGRRRLARGLLVAFLAALLVAAGPLVPGEAWLAANLPGLRWLRFPGKLTMVASFAWALLAGLGAQAWTERRADLRDRRLAGLLCVLALPAVALLAGATLSPTLLTRGILQSPPAGANVLDAIGLDALMCAAAAAVAVFGSAVTWRTARTSGPRWLGAVVLAAVLDLLLPNHRVNVMVTPAVVGRPPETARLLRLHGAERVHVFENDRALDSALPHAARWSIDPRCPLPAPQAWALGLNLGLGGRSASRWGLAGSFAREVIVAPSYDQFRLAETFNAVAGGEQMLRLLQAGGVTHVVARESRLPGLVPLEVVPSPLLAPIRIFRVPDPLPRTYVVDGLETASDAAIGRFLLDSSVDLRRTAVVEDASSRPSDPAFRGRSRITRFRPDEVKIEAEATAPAEVVLLDLYDPGWRATVDGRRAHVARVNGGFRGVAIPEGRHLVRMLYRPPAVIAGGIASMVALCAFTITGATVVVRRRRDAASAD